MRHLLREREGDAKKDATKTLTYAEAAQILSDLHAREQHCRCLTPKRVGGGHTEMMLVYRTRVLTIEGAKVYIDR